MTGTNGNGNGNGHARANAAAISVIPASVVLVICGAFAQAYVRDQNRLEARQSLHEAARVELAGRLGRMEQRLDQLTAENTAQRDQLLALDTTLQREMRLINDTTTTDLQNLDGRLQSEIDRNQRERQEIIAELRERLTELEKWTKAFALIAWTEEKQTRFEGKMGLRLTSPAVPAAGGQ